MEIRNLIIKIQIRKLLQNRVKNDRTWELVTMIIFNAKKVIRFITRNRGDNRTDDPRISNARGGHQLLYTSHFLAKRYSNKY